MILKKCVCISFSSGYHYILYCTDLRPPEGFSMIKSSSSTRLAHSFRKTTILSHPILLVYSLPHYNSHNTSYILCFWYISLLPSHFYPLSPMYVFFEIEYIMVHVYAVMCGAHRSNPLSCILSPRMSRNSSNAGEE